MKHQLSIALIFAAILPAATVTRVECGSASDTGFIGGSRWTGVAISQQAAPYNAMRSSSPLGAPFAYTFTLPSGNYTVTLQWIEPRPDQVAGARILVVAFNSLATITTLDLFTTAGALKPYSASYPVTVTTGTLRIDVSATQGNAILSGIVIDDGSVAPLPATYVTGLESAAPPCPAIGLTFFYATDTDHLFRCYGGGAWTVVGDVRNSAPTALNLQECQGSGPGWNCAGLLWATFQLADKSLLQLVGAPMPGFQATAGTTWATKR